MDLAHIDPELLALIDRHIVRVGWAASGLIAAVIFKIVAGPAADIIHALRGRKR